MNYFKFIGRILGLAIYHRQYLTINFTLLFYKKLLNKPLELKSRLRIKYKGEEGLDAGGLLR